jgi:hypothetical protein
MPDLGVRLQLLVGRQNAAPAPYAVMDSIEQVEVRNRDDRRDTFQLMLALGKGSPADFPLVAQGTFDPPARVVIVAIIGALPEVLVDGLTTELQIVPSNTAGASRLVVTGEDISLKLDLEERSVTYPNQRDSDIVRRILSAQGLVPQVTDTQEVPNEEERVPTQHSTDYAYVEQLARRHGYVFYVEPTDVPQVNNAYWGPENHSGAVQGSLTLNMGPATNVDQPINFSFNALGPVKPSITIVEPTTRLALPIPVPPLPLTPLEQAPAEPLRTVIARDVANLDQIQAVLRGTSTITASSAALQATGELDSVRYGRALRARRLVGIRGAGASYDGTYYVREVTHRIRRGEYRQSFTLTREGRGALGRTVIP